ncbi:class I SAM-dependent RNA methyltransferase [Cytophagales bacterium LB-30]|uniref:Class I SAM-dependent RNA methyltransferase n=1 Tax=Shiella aurantiaca TaxID=3058365 RepID=A0ABT8F529_9BACT|nr:class I SAM-dependent RNA methyltransferase [Shiella aurantiaca]MDN4165408.1 class I SAM-dependent RNA methyltransferase [Shiella aurantiaca]
MKNTISTIVITSLPRLTEITKKEIEALGFKVVATATLSNEIKGTFDDCMFLNLHLRTANKVLFKIADFEAATPKEVYNQLIRIKWDTFFTPEDYFTVTSYAENDYINDTMYPNLLVKDAVADYFTRKFDKRPNSGSEKDKNALFLHWIKNKVNVYFDTSGESISKHGYRLHPHSAPMIEALAAATVLTTQWDKNAPFINPMCGSGTLGIEAALLAINKAPGLLRTNYAFMHSLLFDKKKWGEMRAEAKAQVNSEWKGTIIMSDLDPKALKAARLNAQEAGVEHLITFEQCDFSRTSIPQEAGVIMLNPEYGERLGDESHLEEIYKRIGDFFKHECSGYMGYIFTGNMALGKRIGLKTKRKVEFYNAKIDCRLLEFELYAGSKRAPKEA